MEIILLQKINKLGNIGDKVEVKPGFGRNFLIPTGKALRATKENKEALEGKVKFLQETCRRAGKQIRRLEEELKEARAREHVEH